MRPRSDRPTNPVPQRPAAPRLVERLREPGQKHPVSLRHGGYAFQMAGTVGVISRIVFESFRNRGGHVPGRVAAVIAGDMVRGEL